MSALFFLHFVPFFSDWLNFVAQELKPKEKIYLVNKLHASCRLSHSAHIKTLRKTITIIKRCRINGDCLVGKVTLCYAKLFTSEYIYLSFAIFHRQRMANTTVMSKKSFLAIVDDLSWPNLPRVWNSNMKSWPTVRILPLVLHMRVSLLFKSYFCTVNVDTQKSSICT